MTDPHPRAHAAATADALGAYNHATHDTPGPDWHTPGDAYDATGSLNLAATRLPQAIRQTAALLEHVEAQGRLYSVDNKPGDYPDALAHLEAAADAANQCHTALTTAHRAMSSLAYRTDDEGF